MTVFDDRRCELGEGPLWHPERGQLFWFDILGGALLSRDGDRPLRWELGELASAAGWIDREHLLVASETGLWRFGIATGQRELVAALPNEGGRLRSNDGRADPWGGFWIGMMGKKAEAGAGGIWRLWRGELRRLHRRHRHPERDLLRRRARAGVFRRHPRGDGLGAAARPRDRMAGGRAAAFLELAEAGFHPDGAVVDAEGRFWNAQWGAGRVACYDPDGRFVRAERFEATRTSCPAFGGAGLDTLFVTTAQEGMDADGRRTEPQAGMTFARDLDVRGVPEPAVVLG